MAKTRRFKLLAGLHVDGVLADPEDPKAGTIDVTYSPGDVVESKRDLVRLHGHEKFRELSSSPDDVDEGVDNNVEAAALNQKGKTPSNQQTFQENEGDSLTKMTLDELKATAADEEVDISGLTTQGDIVSAIRGATQAAPGETPVAKKGKAKAK